MRTSWLVKFAILVNHREKIKEIEKQEKYLDLAWEQKNQLLYRGKEEIHSEIELIIY